MFGTHSCTSLLLIKKRQEICELAKVIIAFIKSRIAFHKISMFIVHLKIVKKPTREKKKKKLLGRWLSHGTCSKNIHSIELWKMMLEDERHCCSSCTTLLPSSSAVLITTMGHYVKWTRLKLILFSSHSRQLPHDDLKKKNYHHVAHSLVSHSFKSSVSTILHKIIKHEKGQCIEAKKKEKKWDEKWIEAIRMRRKNYWLPLEIF